MTAGVSNKTIFSSNHVIYLYINIYIHKHLKQIHFKTTCIVFDPKVLYMHDLDFKGHSLSYTKNTVPCILYLYINLLIYTQKPKVKQDNLQRYT